MLPASQPGCGVERVVTRIHLLRFVQTRTAFLRGQTQEHCICDEPDYQDVRKGDDPVEGYLLDLDTSICLQGDESADPKVQISEVQVYPRDWDLQIEAAMRSLLGYRVRVTLYGVQGEMTGHDHRPLVAQVSNIILLDTNAASSVIPRTMSPRATWVEIHRQLFSPSTRP